MRNPRGFQPPRPAYFVLERLEARRSEPPDRESGLWGDLQVEVECVTEIHVGGTAPDLVDLDHGPALIQGMTSLPRPGGPVSVVPGSSVKGAVRAIVEAITPSCERVGGKGCRGAELCPACTVLGAPGWRATVSFSDLSPSAPVELTGLRIAQRYSHAHAPRRGRRLYGVIPEHPLPSEEEAIACLPPGTVLRGTVRLEGVREEGAGLVALALGLPPHGLPLLRLGAGKNRGLAQSRVTLVKGRAAHGSRELVRGASRHIDAAAVDSWQTTALRVWPEACDRLARIATEYSKKATSSAGGLIAAGAGSNRDGVLKEGDMTAQLDSSIRAQLLDEASKVSRLLSPSSARQAAAALGILQRDGVAVLRKALDPATAVLLGASAKHWEEFRWALVPTVHDVAARHGPVGVAYFLGWLKRLAIMSRPAPGPRARAHDQRSPRRRR